MYDSTAQHSDTLQYLLPEDSPMVLFKQERVLIEEIPSRDLQGKKYPETSEMPTDSTQDWVFYILIGLLSLVAGLRVFNLKYVLNNFTALINYPLTTKLYQENNINQRRVSASLHFVYFLSFGLFLYLIFLDFAWSPLNLTGIRLFIILSGFLLTLYLIRFLLMKLTAFIFERQPLFSQYLFHFSLTNKALGILLLPINLGMAYSSGAAHELILYTGIAFVFSLYFLRLVRTILFILKNVVLFFYFILYLCAVEILPFLVILKVILSLTKVY